MSLAALYRYSAYYKAEIQDWVSKLSISSEVIEQWVIVQNLWIYLEAVFVGGDIAKDLPQVQSMLSILRKTTPQLPWVNFKSPFFFLLQEAKRFQDIDKSWIMVMHRAQKVPNVVECCVGDPMLGHHLPELQKQLELCQKSLAG